MSKNELLKAAREQRNPQLLADKIPFVNALGIRFSQEGDALIGQMEFSQHLIGDIGVGALHGGTIGALLESTAIFSLLWEVEDTKMPKTINLTIEYLRSGRPKTTYASATITRHGRRVANVRATAWQEDRDKPIAAAYAHFLLVPRS
jgi:uncharacterized protein (TIGR00369 family)